MFGTYFKGFFGCFAKLYMNRDSLMIARFYVLIMKIVCSDETILLILQGRPHFRKFQLSPDLKLLQWESPNKDKAETEGNVVLSAVFLNRWWLYNHFKRFLFVLIKCSRKVGASRSCCNNLPKKSFVRLIPDIPLFMKHRNICMILRGIQLPPIKNHLSGLFQIYFYL